MCKGLRKNMKRELDYFYIDGKYGWNQEDFKNLWMNKGGCACVTACDSFIYMRKYLGKDKLYPYEIETVRALDYVDFSNDVKPYLRPRWTGIDRLEIYVDGIRDFLNDIDEESIRLSEFSGDNSIEDAISIVKSQIDKEFPIPMLVLMHKNHRFKDFVWHWFLLTGYEEDGEKFMVKVVSYGSYRWFDFRELWNTGHRRKGGLILFDENR